MGRAFDKKQGLARSEKSLPLGEGGRNHYSGRMRGGRQSDFECRGEACLAR